MAMNPNVAAAEIEQFMVPVGPTGKEDPPLGWPDGAEPPPPPIQTVLSSNDSNPNRVQVDLAALGIAAGELAGGAFSCPPWWDGSVIVTNTLSSITLATPGQNENGIFTEYPVADEDDEIKWGVEKDPTVVLQIKRVSDGAYLGVDLVDANTIYSGPAVPPILNGDVVEVKYLIAFDQSTAGSPCTIARPKTPVAGLSTGTAWAGAFRAMVEGATANGIPVVAAALGPCEQAMKAVIDVMMSVPGLAPAALGAGLTAWWGAFAAASAAIIPGSVTTAPPVAAIAAAIASLQPGGPAMLGLLACAPTDPWTEGPSLAAAAILAGVLYASAQGAVVTFSGPAAFPLL